MVVTKYICTKCKAEDQDRSEDGQPRPVALNCWKCHAGQSISLEKMLANRVGMFPVVASR